MGDVETLGNTLVKCIIESNSGKIEHFYEIFLIRSMGEGTPFSICCHCARYTKGAHKKETVSSNYLLFSIRIK